MKFTQKTITEAIDGGYKEFAEYVLESRSIPSVVDGLKPVHRKLLCSMLSEYSNKKVKVAEIGGSLSSRNYHHGEKSAMDAIIGMSQNWNNNTTLFESHGNFGSRLVQESASPRYIYVSLSENYKKFFADVEVAPKGIDVGEPAYYLPIIPWVLVNGVGGMAIGFKTEILPRSVKDVLQSTRECLKDREKFLAANKLIPPTFPNFSGLVLQKSDRQWKTQGIINYVGKYTYDITELPVGYDRATM